jgi:predicted ATPase/DNA-binding SARP family transcriptional activator
MALGSVPEEREERRVIEVGLLGSLTVDDGRVEMSGALERALLARLALAAGRALTRGQLIDDLWGEGLPANSVGSLQTLVYRLRKSLGPASCLVVRADNGYRLELPKEKVDAAKFALLVSQAHRLPETSQDARRDLLNEALGLWRGVALAGLDSIPFVSPQRAALEASRLAALDERIEIDLATGAEAELVVELEGLVAENPLNEKLWGQLMLASYRCGSQADALRCFGRLRTRLADELGIDPSPALVALERSILMQDPALDAKESLPRRGRSITPIGETKTTTEIAAIVVTELESGAAFWDKPSPNIREAMRICEELLVEAVQRNGGRVLSRADGTTFSVFGRSSCAVKAALELQVSIADAYTDPMCRPPLAAAIHVGEIEIADESVFGPSLRIAARLAQAAFGGQVVLSSGAAEMTHDDLPSSCDLLDLGFWLLRDVVRPVHAFELRHLDLDRGFRGLRAGRPGTGTLPVPATSFVGREKELAELTLSLERHQIVTLTGTGGVGKTRLAVEAAARLANRFYGGAWFCDLSTARTVEDVLDQVASALNVHAASTGELLQAVQRWLEVSPALVVLDNCEHVAGEIANLFGSVLQRGAEVSVLFTSRRSLRLSGERVLRVEPLRPQGNDRDSSPEPGLSLLVDRARAAGSQFDPRDPALSEIVDRVDGLPLAIELAARRMGAMSPKELVLHMKQSFDLLEVESDPLGHHGALHSTLAWSFDLLDPTSKALFVGLSVCEGGFDLDLAEAIGQSMGLRSADVAKAVADLWDQSLIAVDTTVPGKAHYRMLSLIREYSAAQLDLCGARDPVTRAHTTSTSRLVLRIGNCRYGPDELELLRTIDIEFANIRAAYASCSKRGEWDLALPLLEALIPEVVLRERVEVARWASEALSASGATQHSVQCVALAIEANSALVEGRLEDAAQLALESLRLEGVSGGQRQWLSRNALALAEAANSRFTEANSLLDQLADLTRESGDPLPRAVALFDKALIASFSDDPKTGLIWAEELIDFADQRESGTLRAMGLLAQGRALTRENPDLARVSLSEAVSLAETIRSILLVRQSKRVLGELDSSVIGGNSGLRQLRNLLGDFGRAGDVSQQLQTVVSALDLLAAAGAYEVVTVLCAGLAETALGSSAQCKRALDVARTRLSSGAYVKEFRRGSSLTPRQLIATAEREFERLTSLG